MQMLKHWIEMDGEFLLIIAFWEIISFCFIADLWNGERGIINKILYSLVLAIPFLGPIIFVCIIDAPHPKPESEQQHGA